MLFMFVRIILLRVWESIASNVIAEKVRQVEYLRRGELMLRNFSVVLPGWIPAPT